jgi:predicted O-methyltransferase YrrM
VISIEINPDYAAFARAHLAKTDAGHKVEIRAGAVLDLLPELEQEAESRPFDVIFLDTEKARYPELLDRVPRLLRPGGLLLADNVLRSGSWLNQKLLDTDADDPRIPAIREFNRRLANHPQFTSIIVPMRAGVAVGLFQP